MLAPRACRGLLYSALRAVTVMVAAADAGGRNTRPQAELERGWHTERAGRNPLVCFITSKKL